MEKHPLCHSKCELNPSLYPVCPGHYPHDPASVEILIVAEAPGKQEVVEGKPLVGSAGKVLWKALKEAGLANIAGSADKYVWAYGMLLSPPPFLALDNVVHCNPPNNRPPTVLERIYCSKHLAHNISTLTNLKLVITLGDTALNFLTAETKILKRRGMPFLHHLPALGRSVIIMPMLHPSFVLRQRHWFDTFVRDLRKASRLHLEGLESYRVEALELSEESTNDLLKTGFAFDIETTGFTFHDCSIIGCSFSNSEGVAYHAWKDNEYQWSLAKRLLESNAYKVAQNSSFDVPFLNYHGVKIGEVDFDTCYAQHLLHPDLPSNLSYIASLYTDSPYYKEQRDELIAGRLTKDQIKQYCCHDSSVTWASSIQQKAILGPLKNPYYNIVLPCARVANNLIRKGVKIKVDRVEETKNYLERLLHPIRDTFKEYGCNLNAPAQIKSLLGEMGVDVEDTRADTLLKAYQRTQHPLIPTMMKYRKLNKVLSTFVIGLHKRVDKDGFLHTSYKVDGTKNSRWSSRSPNLQNIPSEVRKLFIPSEPGRVFIQADYARLELFVAAVLSGDKTFLHDVETTPIHDLLAAELFGPTYTKHQRLLAKTVIFGTIYGRSARSIAIAFGISVAEAQRIQHTVAKKYQALTNWTKISYNNLIRDGFLRSAFNRIRYFEDGNVLSQASNYPVQTAAGDITNTSLIVLNEVEDIRLTVHDSIVIECAADNVLTSMRVMRDIMSRPIPELDGYSFPVTIETGPTWGDLTVLEEPLPVTEDDAIDKLFEEEEEETSYA